MKNVFGFVAENKEDGLKYAYAFMKCKRLYLKECSFFNPNPKKIDEKYIVPRDTFSVSYNEKDLPAWEDFKINNLHFESSAFSCVASLDINDSQRVGLFLLQDNILFNIYGNYEKEAKKAFDDIESIHATLI